MKAAILVNLDMCIGCNACVIGCHVWKQNTEHTRVTVVTIGPAQSNGRLKMDFLPRMTEYCTLAECAPEPPCVSLCPVQALVCCDERAALEMLSSGERYQVSAVA
jgi:Fe-S-cluster-containing dehydrogenase component